MWQNKSGGNKTGEAPRDPSPGVWWSQLGKPSVSNQIKTRFIIETWSCSDFCFTVPLWGFVCNFCCRLLHFIDVVVVSLPGFQNKESEMETRSSKSGLSQSGALRTHIRLIQATADQFEAVRSQSVHLDTWTLVQAKTIGRRFETNVSNPACAKTKTRKLLGRRCKPGTSEG